MGIMVYSLSWVMQDFVHQPYCNYKGPYIIHCRRQAQAKSGHPLDFKAER